MENNETIIEVRGISIKESMQGRKYFSIETENGAVTCFEKTIADEIQKNIGKKVRVEIVENEKGFKNLRKFFGVATEAETAAKPVEAKSEVFAEARAEKNKSMFISYAKDLFIELLKTKKAEEPETAVMIRAIKLIKMTIEAFDSKDVPIQEIEA